MEVQWKELLKKRSDDWLLRFLDRTNKYQIVLYAERENPEVIMTVEIF